MPIDDKIFIDFEDYTGEMDRESFVLLRYVHLKIPDYQSKVNLASLDINNSGITGSSHAELYTRISFLNPEQSVLWKAKEMFLVQGKL